MITKWDICDVIILTKWLITSTITIKCFHCTSIFNKLFYFLHSVLGINFTCPFPPKNRKKLFKSQIVFWWTFFGALVKQHSTNKFVHQMSENLSNYQKNGLKVTSTFGQTVFSLWHAWTKLSSKKVVYYTISEPLTFSAFLHTFLALCIISQLLTYFLNF